VDSPLSLNKFALSSVNQDGGEAAMRRLLALALATALIVGVMTPAAHAGSGTDVALGLASFAVFNQVFGPLFIPRAVYATPVEVTQPVVYYPYPTVYTVPTQVVVVTPLPTVVQYPHGRYELRGDGVSTPSHWIWIPNPPPPPPVALPPPGAQ